MTKSELLSVVEAYAHRNDFAALFDTFLSFVEARIAEVLRTSEMVVFFELDTGTQAPMFGNTWALPDDFLQIKSASTQITGGRLAILKAVGTDEITAASRQTGGGVPSVYNIQDGAIEIRPGPSERIINIAYYGRLAELVNDDDTNLILDRYPAMYAYGCLQEVWDWAQNTEERDKARERFGSELAAVNALTWNQEFGTAPVGSSGYNYSAAGSAL